MQKIKDWFKKVFTKENIKKVLKWIGLIISAIGSIFIIIKLFFNSNGQKEKIEEKDIPKKDSPDIIAEKEIVEKEIESSKEEVKTIVDDNKKVIDRVDKDQEKVYLNKEEREALEKKMFM